MGDPRVSVIHEGGGPGDSEEESDSDGPILYRDDDDDDDDDDDVPLSKFVFIISLLPSCLGLAGVLLVSMTHHVVTTCYTCYTGAGNSVNYSVQGVFPHKTNQFFFSNFL